MEPSTEEIRRELDRKRNELTRDVEQLEAKVKNTFDIRQRIGERPLLSVGLAVLGGVVLGRMGGGHDRRQPSYSSPVAHGTRAPGGAIMPYGRAGSTGIHGAADGEAGLVDQVRAGFQDSVRRGAHGGVDTTLTNITAALTALLVDKTKDMLDSNLPGFANQYDRLAGTMAPGASGATAGGRDFSTMGPSPYTDPLASAESTTAAAGLPGTSRPGSSEPI